MAKKKERPNSAKQALPGLKRLNSFAAYPEDLHLETKVGKKHYDTRVHRGFVERDVRWIMIHGVQDPVLVDKQGDLLTVVAGRGRVINALEANRRLVAEGRDKILIPVNLRRGDPKALFEIGVITNFHRKPEDPVSTAHKLQQYINMGHNEDDCADLIGADKQTIRRYMKTLSLCPEVQQAIVEERVNYLAAIKWADLSFDDQRAALAAFLNKPKKKGPARPTPRRLRMALEASGGKLQPSVQAALEWAEGVISDQEACERIRGLKLEPDATEEAEEAREVAAAS